MFLFVLILSRVFWLHASGYCISDLALDLTRKHVFLIYVHDAGKLSFLHADIGRSMVTASIVLLYVSYAIPVMCLLAKGRNNIKHGPFWLGRFGLFANIVLLCWTTFTVVMYSFPAMRPVTAGSKYNLRYSIASWDHEVDLVVPLLSSISSTST